MAKAHTPKTENMQAQTITFLSLGGEEDVTRNMYLYEYTDQILIVDCGLGFPDESMLGVDLLLPDIAYLLQACMPEGKATKKIVGMSTSQLASKPEIIMRGTALSESKEELTKALDKELKSVLATQKRRITNRVHLRRVIGDVAERHIFKTFHSQPLVLPIVIEV